jgi:hypothetical protein
MKRVLISVTAALFIGLTPTASASSKNCGHRIYAGKNTSCPLARALFKKVGRDDENIADGKRVRVKSPVNGRFYFFFLWRADARSFTCRANGNGVLSVRIAT